MKPLPRSLPVAALLLQVAAALPIPATPLQVPKSAPLPGQVQPEAPGTLPAPRLPKLTLNPPMPQVSRVQYLSNGHIEVASALVLLSPQEAVSARSVAAEAVRRSFAARPQLNEVDVSVYNKGTYGGFGGPLPLLTISVPRARLSELGAWAQGGAYDRAWEASSLPEAARNEVTADKIKETSVNFYGAGHPAKPSSGVQGGLLYMGSRKAPIMALTFDDAPHPMFEPLLLDLLRRGHVRATFFVIGRNAQAYPYFIRDIVEQGHEVGNHTYHHVRLPGLPLTAVNQEISRANQVLQGITNQLVKFFRPPGGDYTPATLSAARSQGLTTVFWTDDPADFQNPGDAVLTHRFSRHLQAGGIILLHDNAPQTLQVFQQFLQAAARRHLTLGTVSDMLRGRVTVKEP